MRGGGRGAHQFANGCWMLVVIMHSYIKHVLTLPITLESIAWVHCGYVSVVNCDELFSFADGCGWFHFDIRLVGRIIQGLETHLEEHLVKARN